MALGPPASRMASRKLESHSIAMPPVSHTLLLDPGRQANSRSCVLRRPTTNALCVPLPAKHSTIRFLLTPLSTQRLLSHAHGACKPRCSLVLHPTSLSRRKREEDGVRAAQGAAVPCRACLPYMACMPERTQRRCRLRGLRCPSVCTSKAKPWPMHNLSARRLARLWCAAAGGVWRRSRPLGGER